MFNKLIKVFYPSVDEAETGLRETDKEYSIVDHDFEAKTMISEDTHKSNEWIILPPGKGRCKLCLNGVSYWIRFDPKRATAVLVPANVKHNFYIPKALKYRVLRDGRK